MFNGVNPEQFHQFIASRSALPLPLPLTLPLHVSPSAFSIHELQPSQQVFQSHLLHPMHHRQHTTHEDEENGEERMVGRSLEVDGMRSESQVMDPWLKEEVVALLAIRSSLGNEFSDFIWSHVSRKLAELGFKRSAEKCKEKFEEVSKYCNNTSYGNSHYRSFNELEALFEDQTHSTSLDDKMERTNNEEGEEQEKMDVNMEENSGNETLENPIEENQYVVKKPKRKKKRKHHQFELLKGFSEFVNKIMVQQEELHKKLLQDMERREEERVVREEAWKKKEMEKLYKEMEIRAQEQAIACDRETKIIEFLNQFTSSNTMPQMQGDHNQILKTPKSSNPPNPSPSAPPPNPNSLLKETTTNNQTVPGSSAIVLSPPPNQISSNNPSPLHNPSPLTTQNPNTSLNEREDYGKRWPRDEVNSLINLRCNLQTNVDDKEGTKAPLWERISQGMLELGYKRSAKKCKEKWENINKYFRKTKDANKKRPIDSKTCPYFHQLNTLYNQGRLVMPSEGPENNSNTHEKPAAMPAPMPAPESGNQDSLQVNEGEKNMVQVPLEFEY